LKQAVLELLVSQDGGVPFMSKSWDGNTSDIAVFQERAQALLAAFTNAPTPRYLIADSKLYHEDNAPHLQKLGFITRIGFPGASEKISHMCDIVSYRTSRIM
jgi:transposase